MDKEPNFAFEKKLGVNESLYGNISELIVAIERLLICMKETNKNHNLHCEFFRLDFRQPYFDEMMQFPMGSLILDFKFGCKKELNEKSNE